MLKYLPRYLRTSNVFKEIIKSEEKQFKKIDVDIEDLRKQLLIDTATWALPIYEKELKIIPVPNSSLEERRAVIKAKWQSQSKLDRILLETVASSILQTIVKVSFNGRIVFTFEPDKKLDANKYKLFDQVIDDIKPAHLGVNVNVINLMDQELYFGGIISTRNKVQILPTVFKIPDLNHEKYFGGVISTRTQTTIKMG